MFGDRPQNTSYCALYHDEPDYKFHMICVQLVEKCWPYLQDRMQNQIFLRTLLHAGKSRRRRQIYNKMQAVMANFAPGAATWLTGRICVVFDSGSFTLLWENMTSSSKHIALSSEEDRATVTGNVNRLFGEIRTCGFWHMRAIRQTDRRNCNTWHPYWRWSCYYPVCHVWKPWAVSCSYWLHIKLYSFNLLNIGCNNLCVSQIFIILIFIVIFLLLFYCRYYCWPISL